MQIVRKFREKKTEITMIIFTRVYVRYFHKIVSSGRNRFQGLPAKYPALFFIVTGVRNGPKRPLPELSYNDIVDPLKNNNKKLYTWSVAHLRRRCVYGFFFFFL